MLRRLFHRLRSQMWRTKIEREMEAELRFHLEMETEENIRRGMSEEEARRAARRSFGGVEQVKEAYRDIARFRWIEDLWLDVRYGVRMLAKRPGFTVVAVLTLSLGIGVNTALFTLFDAFMLKPLPLKDPDSLVSIAGLDQRGERRNLFSYLDYLDYRERSTTLAELMAWNKVAVVLGESQSVRNDLSVIGKGSDYIFCQIVSANYFSMLGAGMALGRGFLPEENRMPGTHPVAVLSHGFWQRQFDGDPNIIGKTIKLQTYPFTVIGVTAREFIGTTPDTPACWIPLMMRDQVIPPGWWHHKRWLTERNAHSFVLLGRLKPGVTQAQARAEMSLIAQQLAQQHPDKNRITAVAMRSGASFVPFDAELLPLIVPLLAAVGMVLMIACANVANLLLARTATRQKEIGVRLALGASRFRVIRQLLTESVLVAVAGGLAGWLAASWTLNALYPIVLSRLPIPAAMRDSFFLNLEPDYRVFGFTLLVALLAGIAAGLAPALQASRPDLTSVLKDEGSTFGQRLSQSRLRNGLIVTQIAVSFALLAGAGLLVRNLQRAQTIDVGFDPKNLLSVNVNLNASGGQSAPKQMEFRRQLAERLRALPGVISVSQAFGQPSSGWSASTPITIDGQAPPGSHPLEARYNFVSPQHFETLGIQIVRGRGFTEQETNTNAPVVVVSESTAEKFWSGQDVVGKRMGIAAAAISPEPDGDAARPNSNATIFPSYEIIGVARDTRSGWVWQKDETYLYVPLGPDNRRGDYLLVRAEGDFKNVMAAVRSEAEAIDPRLNVFMQRTADHLELQMTPFRALAIIAGMLGGLALLLASVGLYGVMSFVVTQRTREIGIRVALGAEPRDVVTLFLKQGLRLTVAGIVIGIAGGAAISRLLAAVLVDLSPLDPITFSGVSMCLAAVAMLACYIPARRATRVDPLVALRRE